MNHKTKILATIGPATSSKEKIEALILAGVNIMRLNMKHSTTEWHLETARQIKLSSDKLKANVSIMFDLQGPSLRTGIIENETGYIDLVNGEKVILSEKEPDEKYKWLPFTHIKDIKNLKKGHKIFIADGLIELKVLDIKTDSILVEVINGERLTSRKNVNIPEADIELPSLTRLDKEHVKAAIKNDISCIALSFVRNKKDIKDLRDYIKKHGGNQIIASKVETLKSVENIDEIIEDSDVVVIARGDLGVEVPIETLPRIQKEIISKCRVRSTPVIVATQMLKSMVENPVPTRAEVADLANAILDKTDVLWVSEETAQGKYPIKVINMMTRVAKFNEDHEALYDIKIPAKSFQEIVLKASLEFSYKNNFDDNRIAGYIVFTQSGKSARFLSNFRSKLPIFAFVKKHEVCKALTYSYGVESYQLALQKDPTVNIKHAIHFLKAHKIVDKGDKLIVIFGSNVGLAEANNSLSIITA